MARKVLWALLVIGLALVAAPFVIGLPDKADGGQKMMNDFRPIMQAEQVQKTSDYYYDVFVPLGEVAPAFNDETAAKFRGYLEGMAAMGADVQRMIPDLAKAMGMTTEQMQQLLATQYPAMAALLQQMPQMAQDFDGMVTMMEDNTDIFGQVPAGLKHYEPLVTTMQGNVENYDKIDGLPPFTWFTWFFVLPGLLIAGLALVGLVFGGRARPATLPVTPEASVPAEEKTLTKV
ncbi:MAG TPA: hypothetical protein VF855_11050 [Acidimicrobiales bacterium]